MFLPPVICRHGTPYFGRGARSNPTKMVVIVITGGRTFGDIASLQRKFPLIYREHPLWPRREAEYDFVFRTLDYAAAELSQRYNPHGPWQPHDLRIIAGGASGADTSAIDWAKARGATYQEYPAEWEKYGPNYAGFIRNQEMLDKELPDLCIAFPGYRGTKDMVRRVRAFKAKPIELRQIKYDHTVTMKGNRHAGTEF
jgi:hypothetical protein